MQFLTDRISNVSLGGPFWEFVKNYEGDIMRGRRMSAEEER